MIIEDKIVKDVLFHLPDWHINNNPIQKRKIKPFIENSDELENVSYRKEVTTNEVLSTYENTKILLLNYIHRTVFPRSPIVHEALCMWSAGILSEKYHFKEETSEDSYNLIKEAQNLLKPYIKQNFEFMCISGKPFDAYEYMEYNGNDIHRNKHYPDNLDLCFKENNKKFKRHSNFNPFETLYNTEKKSNNYIFNIDTIITSANETINITAHLLNNKGEPINDGLIDFYIYE